MYLHVYRKYLNVFHQLQTKVILISSPQPSQWLVLKKKIQMEEPIYFDDSNKTKHNCLLNITLSLWTTFKSIPSNWGNVWTYLPPLLNNLRFSIIWLLWINIVQIYCSRGMWQNCSIQPQHASTIFKLPMLYFRNEYFKDLPGFGQRAFSCSRWFYSIISWINQKLTCQALTLAIHTYPFLIIIIVTFWIRQSFWTRRMNDLQQLILRPLKLSSIDWFRTMSFQFHMTSRIYHGLNSQLLPLDHFGRWIVCW